MEWASSTHGLALPRTLSKQTSVNVEPVRPWIPVGFTLRKRTSVKLNGPTVSASFAGVMADGDADLAVADVGAHDRDVLVGNPRPSLMPAHSATSPRGRCRTLFSWQPLQRMLARSLVTAIRGPAQGNASHDNHVMRQVPSPALSRLLA